MLRYSLRQLEYFATVAEQHSIANAAHLLNVSQPSVSKAITNLEKQLSVQLFIRHHARGVSLTPTGARLLVDARGLLRYASEFQQNAQASSDTASGRLELACFSTVGPVFMPSILSGFAEHYPGIDIKLHEGNQEDLVLGLSSGRFELAFMYDLLLPDDIEIDILASFDPYVLLPEQHPLAKRKRISLASLKDEPLILLDLPPSREYFVGLFRKTGIEPRIAFSSPSLEMVRGLVGRNQGYSLLVTHPYFDFTYDGQTIVTRPLADETAGGDLGIARLERLRPSRAMKVFTEFCQTWFKQHHAVRGPCEAAPIAPIARPVS
jgi:DNA-binding transcriptional LysR family regulator